MIEFAAKITREPARINESDIRGLKAAGFDDACVVDICQVAAYFAYANRIADGLGLELESPEQLGL